MIKKIEDNRQNAKNAIWIFYLMLAMIPISVLSNIWELGLINDIAQGEYVDDVAANANDTRQQVIRLFQNLLLIASAITFLMWYHRAYKNIYNQVNYLNTSPGWAVGYFFIPFANLVYPYRKMRDIWTETQSLLVDESERYKLKVNTGLIDGWWTLFLLQSILGNIARRIVLGAETLEDYIWGDRLMIASDMIEIPALLINIAMIKRTNRFEEELRKKMEVDPFEANWQQDASNAENIQEKDNQEENPEE